MKTGSFKGTLISVLIIASITVLAISLSSPGPVHASLTSHSPILINGDAGFTSPDPVNGGGSGTAGDPYIIENWVIDASSADGITILNTTKYFVIRNCLVENGGVSWFGIYLDNVINGKVENNIFDNNYLCIYLYSSSYDNLTNNTCGNNNYGIELDYSDNNLIDSNIVENNIWDGIELWYAGNNLISNNIVENNYIGIDLYDYSDNNLIENNIVGNNDYGIYLSDLDNNLVSNNTCENGEFGICLYWYVDNNLISNNTCKNNYNSGIYLGYSNNNRIDNNICENDHYGIRVMDSSNNNTISNNTCENYAFYGIQLQNYCDNNKITGNTCGGDSDGGIRVYLSNYNTIENNICENNEDDGIQIMYSDNNTIRNNICENNHRGIYLYVNSDNNILDNNTCSNNSDYGIYLENSSNNNRIENNTCGNNSSGIFLWISYNNILENNICENNLFGVHLDRSDNNLISNNTCENNSHDGIYLLYSDNNLISNNTCENNNYGMFLHHSDNNRIENNTCKKNEWIGIESWLSSNSTLENNTCENNQWGIAIDRSDNSLISGNNAENNSIGIELWYSNNSLISGNNAENNSIGIELDNSDNNLIDNNTARNNGSNGIYLENSNHNTISNNTCENSFTGIYLSYSNNNTVLYDTITGNHRGFYVWYSNNNQIDNNTILATSGANFGSCPFLYTWDGTEMKFFGDINGSGGLGYRVDMSMYGDGIELRPPTSTDYIAIDGSDLVPKEGSYTLRVAEEQDEIVYLDNAELWVIDHSPDVTIYSPEAALATTTPYLYPPVIHTVRNPTPPVSATDWKGNDALPVIASPDGVCTEAELLTDSYITLDLGDLSGASQIKLVYRAYSDWSPIGNVKADQYAEVKNASGEWELVSGTEHFGKPETFPRTYVIDITDWFKTDDWHLRLHTGEYKIHVDWIAVDTSVDEPVTVKVLKPTSANLDYKDSYNPGFEYFFGNFTKYGDVLPLVQEADDEFVIMRAGDSVELKFAEQPDPVGERDFMLVTDAYFKQPFVKYMLGSHVSTVDPLPFHAMSNYPYPSSESYPSDAEHLAYLSEWNTREYAGGDGAGISLPYSDNNTVFGNTIIGNMGGTGLFLESETNTRILNNIISNTSNAIELDLSSNCTISNNTCENNTNYGIWLESSNKNIVSNNTCENNWRGIYLWGSDNNLIENNTVENNYCGIYLEHDSDNNLIENNIVGNNGGSGFELWGSDNNLISNNTVGNNGGSGIYINSSDNNLISSNIVENNGCGFYLAYSDNNLISNNACENNSPGTYLYDSNNNLISYNTYEKNTNQGIFLAYSDNNLISNNVFGKSNIYLEYSDNNLISNNVVENNSGIGLNCHSDNNLISNNTVENNYVGIFLADSDNNLIENNIVGNNWGWGIYLDPSNNNRIYHNDIINNSTQAHDDGANYWDNGYPSGGNYWSDYTGVDENHGPNQDVPGSDGIGDTPYDIPGDSNRDHYPLMNPWVARPVIRGVEVSISPKENDGVPCMTLEYIVTVRNTGNVDENYLLSWTDNAGWGDNIWLSDNWLWVTIGGENTAKLYVHIPKCVQGCTRDNITVTARSKENQDVKDNDSCIAHVKRYLTSLVTNGGLCYFDMDPNRVGQQFRLIFTQNPANPSTYRLTASNPGQFSYNVFYYGNPGDNVDNLKITIPYPFVTQGSVPIHFHDNFENVGGCLVPHGELGGFTVTGTNTLTPSGALGISLSDYDNGLKENVTIKVSGLFPSSGLVYVTIHLDYGLKGKDNYAKGADNNAMNTPTLTIINLDNYNFSVTFCGIEMDNQKVQNVNVFKRDPGFAGMVTDNQGNPMKNVKVQIYGPDGRLLATVYTDEDGYYFYTYKPTGKAATYTVKLPIYNQTKSVTVKANALVEVNFVI